MQVVHRAGIAITACAASDAKTRPYAAIRTQFPTIHYNVFMFIHLNNLRKVSSRPIQCWVSCFWALNSGSASAPVQMSVNSCRIDVSPRSNKLYESPYARCFEVGCHIPVNVWAERMLLTFLFSPTHVA